MSTMYLANMFDVLLGVAYLFASYIVVLTLFILTLVLFVRSRKIPHGRDARIVRARATLGVTICVAICIAVVAGVETHRQDQQDRSRARDVLLRELPSLPHIYLPDSYNNFIVNSTSGQYSYETTVHGVGVRITVLQLSDRQLQNLRIDADDRCSVTALHGMCKMYLNEGGRSVVVSDFYDSSHVVGIAGTLDSETYYEVDWSTYVNKGPVPGEDLARFVRRLKPIQADRFVDDYISTKSASELRRTVLSQSTK